MSNVAEELELEGLRPTKYPNLRVATGGKGPPEGPKTGDNWLFNLVVGTVFLCRANDKAVDWEEYYLLAKPAEDLFYLKVSLPDGNIWTRRVDPKLFCNYHKDYQVLYIHNQEKETEEDNDCGERNPL